MYLQFPPSYEYQIYRSFITLGKEKSQRTFKPQTAIRLGALFFNIMALIITFA